MTWKWKHVVGLLILLLAVIAHAYLKLESMQPERISFRAHGDRAEECLRLALRQKADDFDSDYETVFYANPAFAYHPDRDICAYSTISFTRSGFTFYIADLFQYRIVADWSVTYQGGTGSSVTGVRSIEAFKQKEAEYLRYP